MNSLAGLDYDERGAGEGAGKVVCLVHAGVFSAWFAPLFKEPALDGFRVIRPIRPGYGRSPAPSEPAGIAAHARRCGALLRGLDVTRAHWVGHSSSCCMGLQLALDDPGLVASLILFEPARPSGKQREVAASTYVGRALAAAAQGDIARAFDGFLRGVGGDGCREVLRARLGDDGLMEAERESAYCNEVQHLYAALVAWPAGDRDHRLHWSVWRRRHQARARTCHYRRQAAARQP
jgi:pimeloyl-ACP methyl ester carboxylesterase